MENILISACLMGVECRYDGKSQNIEGMNEKISGLMKKYNLIPVCPEVYGGLQTPRKPAEIRNGRVVANNGTEEGCDVTEQFKRGAEQALWLAKLYKCRYAVLKKRSPSCGHGKIYDGTFSKKLVDGNGVTAALLEENGIDILGEDEIDRLLI